MKFFGLLVNLTLLMRVLEAVCTTPRVRKEIRELTETEYRNYINAVLKLGQRKSGEQYSKNELFTKFHDEAGRGDHVIHDTPAFLPWHRKFIREYELALQQIDPTVNLPYWDWSQEADQPELSPVLTPLYMGGNGNRDKGKILDNGPFNNTQLSYDNPHFLKRDYDKTDQISPFANTDEVNGILANTKFSNFEDQWENVHGYPHNNIGNWEDFAMNTSPNDPLFYLHHAFIDMIWAKWQDNNKYVNQYEGDAKNLKVSTSDVLFGYNVTVNSTLDYKSSYCYTYPAYPRKISPKRTYNLSRRNLQNPARVAKPNLKKHLAKLNLDQALDKLTKLTDLFKPLLLMSKPDKVFSIKGLPEKWIKANNMDLIKVRKFEAKLNKMRTLVAKLNPISDKLDISI